MSAQGGDRTGPTPPADTDAAAPAGEQVTPASGSAPTPPAAPPPVQNRRNKTMRDIALSMGLLVVVVLVYVGLYGGFSFSPGGPSDSGPTPTADATGGFARASRLVSFSPAVPGPIPSDWHPNSSAITDPQAVAPGTPLTVRGGWIIPDGRFIGLVASNADPSRLLASEFGQSAATTGTVDVDGVSWTTTTGLRGEAAWYTTANGITYLITGSADESAFRTLAAATRR